MLMGSRAETPPATRLLARQDGLLARPITKHRAPQVVSEQDPGDSVVRQIASRFPWTRYHDRSPNRAEWLLPSPHIRIHPRVRMRAGDRCSAREFFVTRLQHRPFDVQAHAFHARSAEGVRTPQEPIH